VVLARGEELSSKDASSQTLILVSARVVDDGGSGK
jgi:hypothetical protein